MCLHQSRKAIIMKTVCRGLTCLQANKSSREKHAPPSSYRITLKICLPPQFGLFAFSSKLETRSCFLLNSVTVRSCSRGKGERSFSRRLLFSGLVLEGEVSEESRLVFLLWTTCCDWNRAERTGKGGKAQCFSQKGKFVSGNDVMNVLVLLGCISQLLKVGDTK